MPIFDDAWWNRRTMTDGRLRDGHIPLEDPTGRSAWVYWRFADDLMQRYYRPLGVEVGFGLIGVELYQALFWSPWCQRQPTTFGRWCGLHVHRDVSDSKMPPTQPGPRWENYRTGEWPSWAAFRNTKIAELGLRDAYRAGHEHCFHRRGTAHLPTMFRVGLLLRTNFGRSPFGRTTQHLELGSYPWHSSPADVDSQRLSELLRSCPEVTTAHLPQGYLLTRGRTPLAYLRGNGVALLPRDEQVDVGALLFAGVGVEEVARTVAERVMRPHRQGFDAVTRGQWRTEPMRRPRRVPVPDVTWSDEEWERITAGVLPQQMEDKWFAFMSDGRLHLVRSWTGRTIYEVGLVRTGRGWTISDALVSGDTATYDRLPDEAEGERVVKLINGILLHRW